MLRCHELHACTYSSLECSCLQLANFPMRALLLQRLVTFDPSTFSSCLVEHRLLQMGVPRETATCVLGLCDTMPDAKVRTKAHLVIWCSGDPAVVVSSSLGQ
jgi:hypothetical protein